MSVDIVETSINSSKNNSQLEIQNKIDNFIVNVKTNASIVMPNGIESEIEFNVGNFIIQELLKGYSINEIKAVTESFIYADDLFEQDSVKVSYYMLIDKFAGHIQKMNNYLNMDNFTFAKLLPQTESTYIVENVNNATQFSLKKEPNEKYIAVGFFDKEQLLLVSTELLKQAEVESKNLRTFFIDNFLKHCQV